MVCWRLNRGKLLFIVPGGILKGSRFYQMKRIGYALAVQLQKGCYCGQETVARIVNVGKPPRRLLNCILTGIWKINL